MHPFLPAVQLSLPDQICLKEKETKEETDQYCCFYSPGSHCGETKTDKQGQQASKRLVRLCERTAKGLISGATECSLKLRTFYRTHTDRTGSIYTV